MITENKELFYDTVQKQMSLNIRNASLLYENHQQKELLSLLQTLSPLTSILLNIEISLTNNQIMEESNTLSETLLPFLNEWHDYSFVTQNEHFIMNRFLNSLVRHIKDNNLQVQKGFMLFALYLDAQKIQEILQNDKNKVSLSQALIIQGFTEEATTFFASYPSKLLWPDVISYLKGKELNSVLYNIQILSKLKIQNDPGTQLKTLNNIFAYRKILVDHLIKQEIIDLTIENLIHFLENIKALEQESIQNCFGKEPSKWLQYSQKMVNQEEVLERQVPYEQLQKLYSEMTSQIKSPVLIDEIKKISEEISKECPQYRENMYQCTVTAILASLKEKFIIAIIPTGQGKTWIQALLSKYYCSQKNKTSIVEPNEFLQIQTAEKISQVDFRINITTIEWVYQFMNKNEILIIDEYDDILTNQSHLLKNNFLYGSWLLKDKKVVAFSATSNHALEKFINNTIQKPRIIKIPSQYELLHGIQNCQLGNIISLQDHEQMIQRFALDLRKYYETKPVIVIINEDQTKQILEILQKEKMRFLIGATEQNILEIRQWEYGALVLRSFEVRGVDTKFQKDAIVLIIAKLENDIEYQQFIGRGSRSLGFSEGILYNPTNENSNQIMHKLRKQNFTKYQKLEQVIKLFEKRYTNKNLIQEMVKSRDQQKKIQSLEEVRDLVGQECYQQLVKGKTF